MVQSLSCVWLFATPMDCSMPGFPVLHYLLLLLLLSRFSRVRFCETPQMAAHQAPPSLGFSGKNTGVGCYFLLQCMKVKSESEVAQSCPTLRDSMDCSLPGSSIHGIFQARVLEWGAIAFSHYLLKFAQTHVHWVGDAIQPSHPLSYPSLAFNLSQYSVFSNELAFLIRWSQY